MGISCFVAIFRYDGNIFGVVGIIGIRVINGKNIVVKVFLCPRGDIKLTGVISPNNVGLKGKKIFILSITEPKSSRESSQSWLLDKLSRPCGGSAVGVTQREVDRRINCGFE